MDYHSLWLKCLRVVALSVQLLRQTTEVELQAVPAKVDPQEVDVAAAMQRKASKLLQLASSMTTVMQSFRLRKSQQI